MPRRLIPALAPLLVLLPALLLGACAPERASLASAPRPLWAMAQSDIAIDPAFRTGTLQNGLRFIIRKGTNPAGTALVRMDIAAGSLDERDDERGFAHFVEHMAFNGSTRVPEGEMVRLLERAGLAFGADTNAQTGFQNTLYTLDLPRNDPALLDTALMLMRETASELAFAPAAVTRERGVVLAEMRDRNSWAYRAAVNEMGFSNPRARYVNRLPIGTAAALEQASAERLRAFWQRTYVPAKTTVIVIGDLDPDLAEAAIRRHFASWQAGPAGPQPDAGPVRFADKGRTSVYVDPALSERITAFRHAPWQDERDGVARRRESLLRQIGYDIVNRRLQRLARQGDPPFRSAGLGTSDVFRAGRTTSLVVDTVDGGWQRGLAAAVAEYRRALSEGFTAAEVAEQVANVHAAHRNGAAAAATRSNASLVGAALALVRDDIVPATPESSLQRLEAFIPAITPEAVLAALRRELVPLDDPLLRFAGRRNPDGGGMALRRAWQAAMAAPLTAAPVRTAGAFAYTDFGPPGRVVSDTREPVYGIRTLRFANGVRLNLKPTTLERDRVVVSLHIDGGDMLDTRARPLATDMMLAFGAGGLGRHSQDDLQSILAGRTVGFNLSSAAETFAASAQTTPADLALQLQLMAAFITDPGYRREGETLYRQYVNNLFARKDATPGSALGAALGGILSDNDPRFTLQTVEAYRALSFAGLKEAIADRLAHGAIELGVVGDMPEDQMIALVARTFGALPVREAEFQPYPDQRTRPFTLDRTPRVVRHSGPADQALLRLTWPTRDDGDPDEVLGLILLERVMRIELTDTLREQLGKAYSPSADSSASAVWRGYGTFTVSASVALPDLAATRAAIRTTLEALRRAPVSDDVLQRARQPVLEAVENGLKTNYGWLGLVARAQTRAYQIERQQHAAERIKALGAADIMALARRYLDPDAAVDVAAIATDAPAPARR
ncbi:pitrilysin family protein [Novosphingobium sp.]|uniref:M16 family metallopeptidase n=1 Tax=Novosphingobium sp. TaxID=1874826 RepID=UPI0026365D7C|nr:M16 family metallopeptidase [Novosphingobium sp.]